MSWLATIRDRWGGSIRPSLRVDRNGFHERWDGRGEGQCWSIAFEGFGLTGMLFIGRTPPRGTIITIEADQP